MERAVQLAPGDADALRSYAGHIFAFGEVSAARQAATKAVALDPLNPAAHAQLADIEYGALNYRIAIGHYEKALSLSPAARFTRAKLAFCLMFVGETEEALKQAEQETAPWMRQVALAIIRRKLGDKAGAVIELEQLKRNGPLISYQVAEVLAQWRDIEGALIALRRALEVRDPGIGQAKMDPLLIPLRDDPRYAAVIRRVGLA
jgi:serine/threonine-protein kinase